MSIETVDDIFNFAERIKNTALAYERGGDDASTIPLAVSNG